MTPQREQLEGLSRDELVQRARRAGAKRAEVMTRMELVDEILRLTTKDPVTRKRARGFLGVARDLIASVVEQGLNLPDAAKMIRGDVTFAPRREPQPPVATVTLAEIYIAQGHLGRARAILDDVLRREPEHEVAWLLRARLDREASVPPPAAVTADASPSDAPDAPTPVRASAPIDPAAPIVEERLAAPEPSLPSEEPPPAAEPPPVAEPPSAAELVAPVGRASASAELPVSSAASSEAAIEPEGEQSVASAMEAPAASTPLAVLHRREGRWVLSWELGPSSDRDALPAARVLEVRRGEASPREHRLPIAGATGRLVLGAFAPDSVLRAAVGLERDGAFRASAVAVQVDVSGDEPQVVWAPRRRHPAAGDLVRLGAR